KIRQAFGRPIGSYQGVKHRAADMLVDVENSKSITYYAAWALDENSPEAPLAVSMAKAYVSDAFRRVSAAGIQLHGGIGFTWEHDLHLYFKRGKGPGVTLGRTTHPRAPPAGPPARRSRGTPRSCPCGAGRATWAAASPRARAGFPATRTCARSARRWAGSPTTSTTRSPRSSPTPS